MIDRNTVTSVLVAAIASASSVVLFIYDQPAQASVVMFMGATAVFVSSCEENH